METFSIRDFSGGLLERVSPEDRAPHTAQTLQNFRTQTKGRLIKRAGYDEASLAGTTYRNAGLGGTILGFYEFSRDDPNATIYYVIACSDNKLYKWNPTSTGTWADATAATPVATTTFENSAPDVPKFWARQGVLRVACGDGAANYPLWYGYITRSFFNNGNSYAAYYASRSSIETPALTICVPAKAAGGSLTNGYYFYKYSYVYDGFQEGNASASETAVLTSAGDNSVSLPFELVYTAVNKRISAIRVYRAYQIASATLDTATTFYFLKEIDINTGTTAVNWSGTTTGTITITDTTNTLTPSITTKQGHTSTTVWINYKYSVIIKDRVFYAGIYDADGLQADMVRYSFYSPAGAHCPDVIPTANYIRFSAGDADKITGLSTLVGKLVVYKENTIFRLSTGSGNEFSWSVDEQWGNTGCIAPNSLASAGDRDFFLSRDGVRMYDGTQSDVVSDPAITDSIISFKDYWETAWGIYYQRRKEYWLHIQTGSSAYAVYVYNVQDGSWLKFSLAAQIKGHTLARDGRLLTTEASNILEQDTSSDDNATDMTPLWKSNPITLGSPNVDKTLRTAYITYKSDTVVEMKIFVNRSSTAAVTKSLPIKATEGSELVHLPFGTRGYEFEVQITLAAAQLANTVLEIAELAFDYMPTGRAWT